MILDAHLKRLDEIAAMPGGALGEDGPSAPVRPEFIALAKTLAVDLHALGAPLPSPCPESGDDGALDLVWSLTGGRSMVLALEIEGTAHGCVLGWPDPITGRAQAGFFGIARGPGLAERVARQLAAMAPDFKVSP